MLDRQLRVSNRITGKLSPWKTVRRNVEVLCGKGTGSNQISGTVNQAGVAWKLKQAGVAWKLRTVDTAAASATSIVLPPAALENGNAPSKNKNAGDPGTPVLP